MGCLSDLIFGAIIKGAGNFVLSLFGKTRSPDHDPEGLLVIAVGLGVWLAVCLAVVLIFA